MRQGTRRRMLLALALAAGLGLAMPASAEKDDDDDDDGLYEQPGLYITALGIAGVYTDKNELASSTEDRLDAAFGAGSTSAEAENAGGLVARLGYRINPRVAVEGQFEWLSDTDIGFKVAGGPSSSDRLGLFNVTANAKGYFLTGRIQPYGILGAGWARSRINERAGGTTQRNNNFTARFGGGVDLYGSPDVALTLEAAYVLVTGPAPGLNYVSIGGGLTLRFYPLD